MANFKDPLNHLDAPLSNQELLAKLELLYHEINPLHLNDLFEQDPLRFQNHSIQAADLLIDYSKNRINKKVLNALIELAEYGGLPEAINALFSGKHINHTESRAALHTALRAPLDNRPKAVSSLISDAHAQLQAFTQAIRSGKSLGFSGKPINHIINIGVGGSDLGPALAVDALRPYVSPNLTFSFISNIDPSHVSSVLENTDPETTLFIVASKTFTTVETIHNAQTARLWFLNNGGTEDTIQQHFAAVSATPEKALEFGIAPDRIFPIWDWVGGRYSLWSAIGLPIALAIGWDRFEEFLNGAYQMDTHFAKAPLSENAPVILALLDIWYSQFFDSTSHAVICYEQLMNKFPYYLQQLNMESNGKSVSRDGKGVTWKTGVPLWGGCGTNTQHSFHQLFHQGTTMVSVDFLVGMTSFYEPKIQHKSLFANCLAQSQAMLEGKNLAAVKTELMEQGLDEDTILQLAPHKVIEGNKPSTTIVYPKLTPAVLGQLLALYEHKTFTQSIIWNINAFDQWGVELGKKLGTKIFNVLKDQGENGFDSSTQGLITLYQKHQSGNS